MQSTHSTEQQFKALFQREYNNLCKYAYSYMQDEHLAEDVVQDTFIKIWEQKKDIISQPEIKFYLITAVRNNSISALRKLRSQQTNYTDATPEPEPEPHIGLRQQNEKELEQQKRLEDALNRLPPKCKEVFLLIKMHNMSYKQAAETLDISVKTVENQMGKAIKIFRDYTTLMAYLIFFIKSLLLHRGI